MFARRENSSASLGYNLSQLETNEAAAVVSCAETALLKRLYSSSLVCEKMEQENRMMSRVAVKRFIMCLTLCCSSL